MDAFKSPSPDNLNPLLEIRSYLAANQQAVRAIDEDLKGNSIELRLALQKIGAIEGTLLVVLNRLDRMDRDDEEAKQERQVQRQLTHSQTWIVWTSLIGAAVAIFAAFVPLEFQHRNNSPGAVNLPSVGQAK